MIEVGIMAAVAAVAGYLLANAGLIRLMEPMASRVPAEKHVRFLADGAAHLAAYAAGGVGAIFVWIWVWRERGRRIPSL